MKLDVGYEEFKDYIEKHNLKPIYDGMHTYYVNKAGIELAWDFHGFSFNERSIEVDENYATTRLLQNKF